MAHAVAHADHDGLVEAATGAIADLLDSRTCRWSPGYHGVVGAVLERDASFAGARGPTLPATGLEVPVVFKGKELGRLVVGGGSDEPISVEERHTLVTIADLFAAGITLHDG